MSDPEKTLVYHPQNNSKKTQILRTDQDQTGISENPVAEHVHISTLDRARYEKEVLLGTGAIGRVERVFDHKFQRFVARKTLLPEHTSHELLKSLFQNEAQITGGLQHSGIVPIYDFGVDESEQLYFTMREVNGATLTEAIRCAHDPTNLLWQKNDLFPIFGRICETMAFAHKHGVIHRDLKPENIMIGEHGEVLVMDWGFAKLTLESPLRKVISDLVQPITGAIVGTPIFMSPEQSQGDGPQVSTQSDVFSLGAILYSILTGCSPRIGEASVLLHQIQEGAPLPELDHDSEINNALRPIYQKSIAQNLCDRYSSAKDLAKVFHDWLQGNEREKRAKELVEEARILLLSYSDESTMIDRLQEEVNIENSQLQSWTSVTEKQIVWMKEKRIEQALLRLDMMEVALVEKLHTALNHAPDYQKAHQALADFYFQILKQAEKSKEKRRISKLIELLRIHDRGSHSQYLHNQRTVIIDVHSTEEISLYLLEEVFRYLVAKPVDFSRGEALLLDIGSYLLQVGTGLNYPFVVHRNDEELIQHVVLPPSYQVQGCSFVHSGWTLIGDSSNPDNPERKVFLSSFFIQTHPITNREYLKFLNTLVEEGKKEKALNHVPCFRGTQREMVYGFSVDEDIPFYLKPDADGDLWDVDWPVILIRPIDALAYAHWYSEQTGLSWMLPTTEQWEKTARGVDGRLYPWGDYFEPTWACVRGSKKGRPLPCSVYEYETDRSVYGVRGMAGNVQDHCISEYNDDIFYSKGGAWSYFSEYLSLSHVRENRHDVNTEVCGFRLVHSMENK